MYLDRTYRPRRRRRSWLEFWPLYLLAIIAIVLYEQQPGWLIPREVTPTPVPTRAAIAFLADAESALNAADYNVALEAYRAVTRLEPLNGDGWAAQSEIYLMMGNVQLARQFGQRAVDAAPENPRALTALARAANWDEDNEAAADFAFDALEINPQYATAMAVLAEVYTDVGNWALAEEYLQKALTQEPNNITALRNRAYLFERQADYENAINAMNAVIAVAPRRFDLYLELGRMYRVGLLDYTKANEAYAKAVSVYESPITLDAQGDGLYNAGDHPQAVRILRKAVELDPEYGPALVHLGMALYARRNYEDAAPSLEKGLGLIGDRARIEQFYTAGLAYINKEPRDCSKAIPWLEKALAMDANAPPAVAGMNICGVNAATPTPESGL